MDHDAPPPDPLGIVADAAARADETIELAARHLDPSLIDVLRILGFDQQYATARGSHLYDRSGRAYLDFHTGEGFASLGHNHPDVREVLEAMLDAELVDGVQIHYSVLAGMLAESLADRLPARLDATFFASAGAEAVDSAMKFARAATGRPRLLSCDCELPRRHARVRCRSSATSSSRRGSGRCCPVATGFRSATSTRLEAELRKRDVAAFIVEPIQGGSVHAPARWLPARRPGAVPPLRHPVRARRDPDRARPHREVVRARALGPRARLRAGRQGAQRRLHAGRGDGHHAATSSSRRSARSSAPTCTSRPSGATGCRWPPVWPRCGSSSATSWSSIAQPLARR